MKDDIGRLEGGVTQHVHRGCLQCIVPWPIPPVCDASIGPLVSSVLSHLCLPSFIHTTGLDDFHLSIHSDMATIVKAMASPESGLEVRDRMWLKITIPNAFIGKRLCCLQQRQGLGSGWLILSRCPREHLCHLKQTVD